MTVLSNKNYHGVPNFDDPDYRQWCNNVDAQTVRQLVFQACSGLDTESELANVLLHGLHCTMQDIIVDNSCGFGIGLEQDIYDIVAREIWFGNLIVVAAYLEQPLYRWLVPASDLYTLDGSKQTLPDGVQTDSDRVSQHQNASSPKPVPTPQTVMIQEEARVDPPARFFSIQLQDGQALGLSGVKYRLIIGASDNDPALEIFTGSSRDDGRIQQQYYSDASKGVLQYWPDAQNERCVLRTIQLGPLSPVDSERGQTQRLSNLGYVVNVRKSDAAKTNNINNKNDRHADPNLALALQSYRKDTRLTQASGPDVAQHIDMLT